MKRLFALFLAPLLVVSMAHAADWVSLSKGATQGAQPQVKVLSNTARSTVLEVTIPGFWATQTAHGWRLSLPGEAVTMVEGRPELPFVGLTVAMPSPGSPSLRIVSAQFTAVGNYKVRMAPKPSFEEQPVTPPAPIAPGIAFPEKAAKVVHTGYWREVPMASMQINPFKSQGNGLLVGVASRMVVEVNHVNPPASWPTVALTPDFREILNTSAVNGKFVPSNPPSAQTDAPAPEYLVVANTALASAIAPLVTWRHLQGFETKVISTSSSSPATIKSYIATEYAKGKLKYVLLVGDYAQIKWYVWSYIKSDAWYACLTGGSNPDLFPDVGLGRICATSTTMVTHQVAKILKYEQTPPSGTWYTKTILAAHRQGAPGKYVGCSEQIANGPLKTSGWSTIKQYGNNPAVYNSTVTSYINGGVGLVNYRGHGSTTSWASGWNTHSGGYTTTIVNNLKNGDKTPIVFNIACYCANFQSTCLNETWLQAKDGAVASLSAIQPSYTTPNHEYDKTLYSSIFGTSHLTNIYAFTYKATQKIISMGTYGQKNARMYMWCGDAATSLWYHAPWTLSVTKPSSIPTGSQHVGVTVKHGTAAVAHAKVCLYKAGQVFAVGYTNSSGYVSLSVNPTTTGLMNITVTGFSLKPYRSLILVTGGGPNLPVIPAGFAKKEGNSSHHIPAKYAPSMCQTLYDPSLLGELKTGYIKGLKLRRNGTGSSYASHYYNVETHVSSLGVPKATGFSRYSYKKNRGLDYTLVMPKRRIYYPATPIPHPAPAKFTVSYPFNRYFRYYKGRSLLIEMNSTPLIAKTESKTWYADANYQSATGTYGKTSKYGRGCPSGKSFYGYAPPINGMYDLYWAWSSGSGLNVPAIGVMGVSNRRWGFLRLPFSLFRMGAPGCYVNCDIVFTFPGRTTNAYGYYKVTVRVPRDPNLVGATVYTQTYNLKRGYNFAGIMASEGLKMTLGGLGNPAPAIHNYSYYLRQMPPFPDKPHYTTYAGLIYEVNQ